MQHTNTWSPMPARQTKNRSAMTVLTILNARDCEVLGSHYRGESGRKDGKLGAVLGYFTSQSLTGKGAWLQHGWSTQCKDSFPKPTPKGYAQISASQTSLGGLLRCTMTMEVPGQSSSPVGSRHQQRALFPCRSWGSQFKRKVKDKYYVSTQDGSNSSRSDFFPKAQEHGWVGEWKDSKFAPNTEPLSIGQRVVIFMGFLSTQDFYNAVWACWGTGKC